MTALIRFLLPLAALVLMTACPGETPLSPEQRPERPIVSVAETVPWHYPATTHLPGVVRPGKRAVLSTRIAGTLISVAVAPGDEVKKGELLAAVDAREVKAAIASAEAKVAAAQSAVLQAELDGQRLRRLFEEDLVARVRIERVAVRRKNLAARLQTARSELEAQQANLSYTRLTAPFSGQVTETLADTGSFVVPGQPLVMLEDRRRLRIDVPVSSGQAAVLTPGQQLPVFTKDAGEIAEARLISVIPALTDGATGQRLRLSLEDPPAHLNPGEVVTVVASQRRTRLNSADEPWVGLPEKALIRRGQLTGTLVVVDESDEEPEIRLRWIMTAAPPVNVTDLIPVTQGLKVGERVVLDPSPNLQDGQAVAVKHTEQNLMGE